MGRKFGVSGRNPVFLEVRARKPLQGRPKGDCLTYFGFQVIALWSHIPSRSTISWGRLDIVLWAPIVWRHEQSGGQVIFRGSVEGIT